MDWIKLRQSQYTIFFLFFLMTFFFLLFTCNLIYRNDSNFILIPGNVNFCKSVKQCMFVFYIMRLVIMSVFYHWKNGEIPLCGSPCLVNRFFYRRSSNCMGYAFRRASSETHKYRFWRSWFYIWWWNTLQRSHWNRWFYLCYSETRMVICS